MQVTAEEAAAEYIVPGSVPVTGTYSETEAEYQAAMGGAAVGERSAMTGGPDMTGVGAGAAAPVGVGVAEVRMDVCIVRETQPGAMHALLVTAGALLLLCVACSVQDCPHLHRLSGLHDMLFCCCPAVATSLHPTPTQHPSHNTPRNLTKGSCGCG